VLLVFPAQTYRLEAFLQAAERVGVELVLATDLPGPFARHGRVVLAVDFADPEGSAARLAHVLQARTLQLTGTLGTHESSALVAALTAAALGLPHSDVDGTRAAGDKRRMRERLAAAGVPGPRFLLLEPDAQPEDLLAQVRFPCVVKPTMLTGSQGVIRADDPAQLVQAVARVRNILSQHPSSLGVLPDFHRLLIEDYLPGQEVSVEALVDRGRVVTLAIFDKPDDLCGPYFEETIYVTPSRLPRSTKRAIIETTARAAIALGLTHGPVHAELRTHDGEAAVVEVAARSIGGLCSRTFELAAGSLEELLLVHAAGLGVRPRATERAAGVMMMPIPRSGVLRGVRGLERARAVSGIESAEVVLRPGEAIRALPEGMSYLGFIFARADTADAVEAALRAAHAEIEIDLSPLLT
jgi:biotin carboxylase